MKAMRKEPRSRYGSVTQLDDDVRRHLEGLPVLARRGTLSYRAGKFARRHRVLLAAAALVAIALAGGVFATLREARHARLAEARAKRRFDDVRKLANSFLFEFHDAIRDLPGSTPARALVVRRAVEYLDSLAQESAGDRVLRRELSEAYQKVGDVEGNPYQQNLGDLKGAIASYAKAIALLEPVVASGSATDEEQSTLATAYLVGGGIQVTTGDSKTAVAMAEKGLALRRGLAERHPNDPRRAKDLAQAWQFYAWDLSAAGRMSESYEALRNQAAILKKRLAVEPRDRQLRRSLGQNLSLTGQALQARGDLDGALKMLQEAALVDGATHFQAFRKVVLPLAAPGLVTAGLLTAFFVWNEFLLAVTLTSSPSAFTVPVAVANFTGSQEFEVPLGTISAASVVITIPLVILVIIFQRRIVAGMTAGAVKG